MNEFVELSKKYPPRCIEGYSLRTIDECFGGYTSEYGITCKCGSELFELVGELEPDLGMEPLIYTRCISCKKEMCIVNVNEYGYDAEYGHGTDYPEMVLGMDRYLCSCNSSQFRIVVWFTYQFESIDDFKGIGVEKVSNYFDVVGVTAKCNCGETVQIGGFECA